MANKIVRVREFLAEVVVELKESAWPNRKELTDSTIVVIVSILLLGAFVAAADFVFVRLLRMLTGT